MLLFILSLNAHNFILLKRKEQKFEKKGKHSSIYTNVYKIDDTI